jgi:hypothetical protein
VSTSTELTQNMAVKVLFFGFDVVIINDVARDHF